MPKLLNYESQNGDEHILGRWQRVGLWVLFIILLFPLLWRLAVLSIKVMNLDDPFGEYHLD